MYKWGGYGPGAYYPWIYLQFAIIIPFLRGIMSNNSKLINALILIAICEILEVSYSLLGFPDSVYRLLCFRYLFLIYLGWKWVKEGICMTKTTICLSLVSLILCIYFGYVANDTEPFLFNTSWRFHRWPCYYYVSHLYAYVLFLLYSIISKSEFIKKTIDILSKSSYEIFLVQMVLIYLIPNTHQSVIYSSLWMLAMWVLSLTIGITIYKLRNFQWKRNFQN